MTPLRSLPGLALALCLGSCADQTPTSVVGTWALVSIEGSAGERVTATSVLAFELREDGTVAYAACPNPSYEGGTRLVCNERLRCASGTYTLEGERLVLRQTGRTETRSAQVGFEPGAMILYGAMLIAPWITSSRFEPVDALTTDCEQLP